MLLQLGDGGVCVPHMAKMRWFFTMGSIMAIPIFVDVPSVSFAAKLGSFIIYISGRLGNSHSKKKNIYMYIIMRRTK